MDLPGKGNQIDYKGGLEASGDKSRRDQEKENEIKWENEGLDIQNWGKLQSSMET